MDICKDRKKCCCFTGHRPYKLGISENKAKQLLSDAVDKMIKKGYTTFISGMAQGIDMWAAEVVLSKREKNPAIFLVCVSPYKGMENKWNEIDRQKYNSIIEQGDEIIYLCEHYTSYCFHARNNWMVNHSSMVIAAYNNEDGGTKNTVQYALKNDVEVYNILLNV